MTIKNLDKFKGKMRWTTISEDGKVLIRLPQETFEGAILYSTGDMYFLDLKSHQNEALFKIAGVDKLQFMENVLGYRDRHNGDWPWMKSADDVVKVLAELDRLYVAVLDPKEPKESKQSSIETLDFTPKKKHYSFNFQM